MKGKDTNGKRTFKMVDITHKTASLRQAIAGAVLRVSQKSTIEAIENKTVPKGDIFEFSRAAALLGIKKTSDLIPDCHPLPVEYAAVRYRVEGLEVHIEVEVHTIYKTGVEVEAMHGASIAALVMYDMLKPLDKGVEIGNIRLLKKTGGKSDMKPITGIKAAVVVCSDRAFMGEYEDKSGKYIREVLEKQGCRELQYSIVPDEVERIQAKVQELHTAGTNLIILTGGTGVGPRDVSPEAVAPLIDQFLPGVMEAARQHGQQKTKSAMLSRGVAGFYGDSLILTLPGSLGGVRDSLEAVLPQLLHVFEVKKQVPH